MLLHGIHTFYSYVLLIFCVVFFKVFARIRQLLGGAGSERGYSEVLRLAPGKPVRRWLR